MSSISTINKLEQLVRTDQADELAKTLASEKVDVDIRSSTKATLMHLAAHHNSIASMNILHLFGANPNARTYNGLSPMHTAAYYNHEAAIRFLHAIGGSINAADDDGETPLMHATVHAEPLAMKTLIELGANPHTCCDCGYTAKAVAVMNNNPQCANLLYKDTYATEFVHRKLIGHFHGIAGTSRMGNRSFSLEGEHSKIMLKSLTEEFSSFFSTSPRHLFSKQHRKQLFRALDKASKPESSRRLASRIQSKALVILSTGWEEHWICLVFFNDMMAICNRGEGVPDNLSTVECYRIESRSVDEEMLNSIRYQEDEPVEVASKFFYFKLPGMLAPSFSAKIKKTAPAIKKIAPKFLEVGTCAAASAKAALLCAGALLKLQHASKRNVPHLLRDVKAEIKDFSSYMRVTLLNRWLQSHFSGDLPIDSKALASRAELIDIKLVETALTKLQARLKKHPAHKGSMLDQKAQALFKRCVFLQKPLD